LGAASVLVNPATSSPSCAGGGDAAAYVAAYALLSTGGVLLRAASDVDELAGAGATADPYFIAGFLLYALSFFTWLLALRMFEVVAIFPVFVGVGYACVVLGAYFFLNESLTASRVAGILVIFAGIALLYG
jgi:multidrug transporter EmrE-like cation transporter